VFNPLDHRGMAVTDQLRSWSELNVQPYSKLDIHPYSRSRIILMNGIEVEPARLDSSLWRSRARVDSEML